MLLRGMLSSIALAAVMIAGPVAAQQGVDPGK